MSWISLDDFVNIIQFALDQPSLSGPVNVVSPNPVTNKELTQTLGRLLHRPTLFPVPAFAARWAFGQIADELFLASAKVHPHCLLTAGYAFKFPTLEAALKHHLKIENLRI
jgi:NAD dependent epimerase/dehydratase family enzyme